jgi:hypothetical protein
MREYSLSHLSDQTLLHDLAGLVARDRVTTAELLAHIAEVDARRLWAPAGHPSMQAYCVEELHLSEDSARRRIHAANVAQRVPVILQALAEGRLSLSSVLLLGPWLTLENADDLIGAATHKTKYEIQQLIADRFPRLDVPAAVQAVGNSTPMTSSEQKCALERISVKSKAKESAVQGSSVEPLATERYALQLTMDQTTHDKLRHLQRRLSHRIPSGDLLQVFNWMLDLANRELDKTPKPRLNRRTGSANPRYISTDIKQVVRERDGDRCTFVSDTGRRCSARTFLEYDHIVPVARGGLATAENLRLRCPAHNRYAAECQFGTEFMNNKCKQARQTAAERKAIVATPEDDEQTHAGAATPVGGYEDVVPWLRQLGFTAAEARQAASHCESIPGAPLEQRVRVALSHLGPRAFRVQPVGVP